MIRILISLMVAATLTSPAFAQSTVPDDSPGSSGSSSFNDVAFDSLDNSNRIIVDDGKGVAVDNTNENIGAKSSRASAAANNGSSAYVDNSVFQKDSALSRTDMEGQVNGNAVNMQDSKFVGINKIDDDAFKDAKGVNQVSQSAGQNNLIQQSFTIQSNLKVDHRSSSSP